MATEFKLNHLDGTRAFHALSFVALPFYLLLWGSAADESKGSFRTEIAEINLEAREGLVFHPARVKFKSGSLLVVNFTNNDPNDMPHNVCLVAPETLAEIQRASLAIDSGAEARGFVPESAAILAHSELIGSEESTSFSYQFSEEDRGVYYLVCTFPGHAAVMYTPLYVGMNPRFSLAEDPEVSPVIRQQEINRVAALKEVKRPSVLRVIMDDTGPATILVALPDGMNYCWDANTCRLRYTWAGAFANPLPHFDGNGAKRPLILGEEFWRSLAGESVRGVFPQGAAEELPDFLGYDLVDGIPTFRYRVNGTVVHERITSSQGALKWSIQLLDMPAKKEAWRVLAPESEQVSFNAPGAKRDGDYLVFSSGEDQPFEITMHPELP